MPSRALTILNAIGCLALTALAIAHWHRERLLDQQLTNVRSELTTSRTRAEEDARHRAALERDIAALKVTILATQQAAESSSSALAEKDGLATRLQTELTAAREQLAAWQAAIQLRDERLKSLDAELAATRERLDQAIANLKAAGSR